jgi:hypothetical protein
VKNSCSLLLMAPYCCGLLQGERLQHEIRQQLERRQQQKLLEAAREEAAGAKALEPGAPDCGRTLLGTAREEGALFDFPSSDVDSIGQDVLRPGGVYESEGGSAVGAPAQAWGGGVQGGLGAAGVGRAPAACGAASLNRAALASDASGGAASVWGCVGGGVAAVIDPRCSGGGADVSAHGNDSNDDALLPRAAGVESGMRDHCATAPALEAAEARSIPHITIPTTTSPVFSSTTSHSSSSSSMAASFLHGMASNAPFGVGASGAAAWTGEGGGEGKGGERGVPAAVPCAAGSGGMAGAPLACGDGGIKPTSSKKRGKHEADVANRCSAQL